MISLFASFRWCLIISCPLLMLTSCLSKAKLTDLPKDKSSINFTKLEVYRLPEGKKTKSKTQFEYFIELDNNTKIRIEKLIIQVLTNEGFETITENANAKCIKAERGLRNNEWGTVAGVYYETKSNATQIYIICKITQDITGGWYVHRAKKIGEKICELHGACVKSFVLESN